jgi:hypothetical protein
METLAAMIIGLSTGRVLFIALAKGTLLLGVAVRRAELCICIVDRPSRGDEQLF